MKIADWFYFGCWQRSGHYMFAMRMLSSGKSTCRGDEIAAVVEALNMYRIQLSLCTQAEMAKRPAVSQEEEGKKSMNAENVDFDDARRRHVFIPPIPGAASIKCQDCGDEFDLRKPVDDIRDSICRGKPYEARYARAVTIGGAIIKFRIS